MFKQVIKFIESQGCKWVNDSETDSYTWVGLKLHTSEAELGVSHSSTRAVCHYFVIKMIGGNYSSIYHYDPKFGPFDSLVSFADYIQRHQALKNMKSLMPSRAKREAIIRDAQVLNRLVTVKLFRELHDVLAEAANATTIGADGKARACVTPPNSYIKDDEDNFKVMCAFFSWFGWRIEIQRDGSHELVEDMRVSNLIQEEFGTLDYTQIALLGGDDDC